MNCQEPFDDIDAGSFLERKIFPIFLLKGFNAKTSADADVLDEIE